MSCLHVKGFGGLELIGNGEAIQSYPTHHVEELLGYLLLNQGKMCSREKLISLLWPYEAYTNGRGCLSTVLWRSRNIFRDLGFRAASFIQTTRDYIIFNPLEPLEFDVECFECQMDIALSAKDDTTKEAALISAINLYEGDLYAGVFADWCLIEREYLARKHLQAIGELMHCYIRQERFDEAVNVGQSILKIDPLREEIHRALITCYGRLGRRAEAAAQFQRCAEYLMTDLQVFPMPDTVCAYQHTLIVGMSINLPRPYANLLKRAVRATAEFQQAGDRLVGILDEIENLNTAILS